MADDRRRQEEWRRPTERGREPSAEPIPRRSRAIEGFGAYPRRYWGIGGEGFRRSRAWVEPEPPTESFAGVGPRGYHRSDDRIREDLCRILTDHPHIDATDIDIDVREGEVHLRGTVDDRRTRMWAIHTADGVSGVHDVISELRVRRRDTSRR